MIDTLGAMGRLRNTYVIFTSDNGFFFGEHRLLGGKFLAYEPATHLPLLIRGPGIKPGSSTGELAANIDIAPTILELAGAEADKSIDGRSLVPYMDDPDLRTRRPILFESFVETSDVEAQRRRSPATAARATASARRAARSGRTRPPRSWRRRRTTRESASAPTSTSPGRAARRSSTTSTKDPYELNNIAHGSRTSSRSATSSTATAAAGLETASAEPARK